MKEAGQQSDDRLREARRHAAVEFLRMSATGRAREAYDKYVAGNFRHHNPYFAGDAASLRAAMEKNAAEHPDKTLEVQRVLSDHDLVAVHSRVRPAPAEAGLATIHLFRFEGDRIAELWDLGQPVPQSSPNENGMF